MDTISLFYYFGVLAILVAAIWVLVFIIKKFTKNKARTAAKSNDIFDSKTSSLFIQEVLPIDQKTKIVIVGRDNLRHVILLGETHSNLIETVTPNSSIPAGQTNKAPANTTVTASHMARTNTVSKHRTNNHNYNAKEAAPDFSKIMDSVEPLELEKITPPSKKSISAEQGLTTNIADSIMNQPAKTSIKPKPKSKPESEPKAAAKPAKADAKPTIVEAKKTDPETKNSENKKSEINKSETNKKGIVSKLQDAKDLSDTAKD